MTNHYDVLGVAQDATQDEIKQAWRRKASEAHPDRDGGDAEAMARINQAYEVLGDPERRQNYDAGGEGSKATEIEEKVTKALVTLISKVLDMSGNMVTNATRHINSERDMVRGQIAENKILLVRVLARKKQITAENAPSGNVASILLDQKAEGHTRAINTLEKHLLVLDGVEEELKHYCDTQKDPSDLHQFYAGSSGAAGGPIHFGGSGGTSAFTMGGANGFGTMGGGGGGGRSV